MEWTFAIIFVHDTIHFCPQKRKENKFSGSFFSSSSKSISKNISSLSLFKLCFCFRTILWWDPLRKELEFHLRLIIIEHWWVLTKPLRGAQVRKEFDGSGNLKEGGGGRLGGQRGRSRWKKQLRNAEDCWDHNHRIFLRKTFFFVFCSSSKCLFFYSGLFSIEVSVHPPLMIRLRMYDSCVLVCNANWDGFFLAFVV